MAMNDVYSDIFARFDRSFIVGNSAIDPTKLYPKFDFDKITKSYSGSLDKLVTGFDASKIGSMPGLVEYTERIGSIFADPVREQLRPMYDAILAATPKLNLDRMVFRFPDGLFGQAFMDRVNEAIEQAGDDDIVEAAATAVAATPALIDALPLAEERRVHIENVYITQYGSVPAAKSDISWRQECAKQVVGVFLTIGLEKGGEAVFEYLQMHPEIIEWMVWIFEMYQAIR
jgi:hypothetical protein